MNLVFLIGNISSDIYFDHLHIKETMRPFLRLFLFCHQPREVKGLRVNLWDEKADLYYPYLQRGSRIAVVGNLISREFKGSLSHEVEALNLILLRNINWEYGEKERLRQQLPKPSISANNVFVIGTVEEDIYFDWYKHVDRESSYAFLRLLLKNEQYIDGLRVNIIGSLAELAYPYVKKDCRIAVDGHFQTRDQETGKRVVEVTAEHVTFLEGVDWMSGSAARAKLLSKQAEEFEK